MNAKKIRSYSDLKALAANSQSKSELMNSYVEEKTNFIPYLLPEEALKLSVKEIVDILSNRFGSIINEIISKNKLIESPVAFYQTTDWIKTSNMVGINIRTIGNVFNIIKYALTIPSGKLLHNSLHILPIWEPGVVGSLYAISSWNLNNEFFSEELVQAFPELQTVESQLKVVVNLLHLMNFTVGMDVIPHTDRFSEIVLVNPSYFEWLQRKKSRIINHSNNLHEKIEELLFNYVSLQGPAVYFESIPKTKEKFFRLEENLRSLILFGKQEDTATRSRRRNEIINILFKEGYETAPATMAPPYRGLKVKENLSSTSDDDIPEWRDYEIEKPEPMSRVFGPLTRYKFYENKDNNANWEIDFEQPRLLVFNYLQEKYLTIQKTFNFDFMRGDMSHVQMRPNGVPYLITEYYDPLKAVKNYIQKEKKYFGYFAESFLAPPNTMAYGNEIDHLEATDAEVVLGDLQSLQTIEPEFFRKFRQYLDIKNTRKVVPSFTIITSDKDDPRFDRYYLVGNEFRYFVALFLLDVPSYYSLGFEVRDTHQKPFSNEFYTKLFVFQEREGPKKTTGPYQWGSNWQLFVNLTKIRLVAESLAKELEDGKVTWLLPPDPLQDSKILSWIISNQRPKYFLIANSESKNIKKKIFWLFC